MKYQDLLSKYPALEALVVTEMINKRGLEIVGYVYNVMVDFKACIDSPEESRWFYVGSFKVTLDKVSTLMMVENESSQILPSNEEMFSQFLEVVTDGWTSFVLEDDIPYFVGSVVEGVLKMITTRRINVSKKYYITYDESIRASDEFTRKWMQALIRDAHVKAPKVIDTLEGWGKEIQEIQELRKKMSDEVKPKIKVAEDGDLMESVEDFDLTEEDIKKELDIIKLEKSVRLGKLSPIVELAVKFLGGVEPKVKKAKKKRE